MSIFLGSSELKNLNLGGGEITSVYLGGDKIWPSGWTPDPSRTIAYRPLNSITTTNDMKGGTGTKYNLTNSGITFGNEGGVDCAKFTGTITGNSKGLSCSMQEYNYPITVSVWFKTNGNGSGGGYTNRWMIFRYAQSESSNWGSGSRISTAYYEGGLYSEASYGGRYGNGYHTDATGSTYSDGVWHNAIYVSSGSYVQLFIDGNKIGEEATPNLGYGKLHNMNIGKNAQDNYYGYNGLMSEFIIESKARTADEVRAYYNSTKGTYGL